MLNNGNFTEVKGATKIWGFTDGQSLTYAANAEKLVGFIDRNGQWVIQPTYKKVKQFVSGLAPVTTNGKQWGFINEKGEIKIKESYRDAEIFSIDGLAPVKVDKYWGFINKNGELVIEDKYAISAMSFNTLFKSQPKGFIKGLSRVGQKKKWGYINTKGELLNDTWYDNAENFVEIK